MRPRPRVVAPTASRRPRRLASMRRITARVGGRSRSSPTTSVMNPGVTRNAPPKMTSTPSITSRWGIFPSPSAVLKRRQTLRPCARRSSEPSTESAASRRMVQTAPIASPTLRITYSSASGTIMNSASSATRGMSRTLLSSFLMPTVDDVQEALTNVIDPELGLDFVELGLIYDVEIEDDQVYVTFTLTSPGCPIGPQVAEQVEEFVGELDGVAGVYPKMTFSPPWTPEMMSEEAKFALGY